MEQNNFSFQDLKEKIEIATKKGFLDMIKKNDSIYSFALYSDENCETLSVAGNTPSYLEKAKTENKEAETDHYSKYSPEEWDYTIDGARDEFNEISEILGTNFVNMQFEGNQESDAFNEYRTSFYQICVDTLLKLKSEDFFLSNFGKEIFITFYATEFEFENSIQNQIIEALNDNEYCEEYLEWESSEKNSFHV